MNTLETLEERQLMSATAFVAHSALNVYGTNAGDTIVVRSIDNGQGLAAQEFDYATRQYRTLATASTSEVSRIIVKGHGGRDNISIEQGVNKVAYVYGGAGQDSLSTAADVTAFLYGGDDHDTLWSDSKAYVKMHGGNGNDTFHARGRGTAYLFGDAGNDTAKMYTGRTLFNGGDGWDTADYSAWNNDVQIAFNNHWGSGFRGGTLTHNLADNIEVARGGSGDDLIVGTQDKNALYGNAGHDLIYALAGNDTVEGGDGNDTVYAGDGNDLVLGGAGNDILRGDDGRDRIFGGDDHDQIYGGDGMDYLNGELGNDWVQGDAGADILIGGFGNDWIDSRDGEGGDIAYGGPQYLMTDFHPSLDSGYDSVLADDLEGERLYNFDWVWRG